MTTVQITFPWGRYYAHPWGINPTRLRESEWPPSPWRLLRALVSAWFRAYPGQVPSEDCIKLIETLGRELPLIGTGKVSFSQTVHWQPNYGAAGTEDRADASYKNTRHENHFAAVSGPVVFQWQNVKLVPEQRELLVKLLAELSYFGRAESLCRAELCETELGTGTGWCYPTDGRKISACCRDVFCTKPNDFQYSDLWIRRKNAQHHDPNNAPPHFVDTLLSSDIKTDGAAWVSYKMPDGWPQKWIVRTPRQQLATQVPPRNLSEDPNKVAHYLRFSLQCRVPIPWRFTVDIAEKFRTAANSYIANGVKSFALLGKKEDRPEGDLGYHQHAFFLPTAEDPTLPGCLTDIHIWCPFGFTRAEVDVLLKVRRLGWKDHRYPANPVLVAMAKEPPKDALISTSAHQPSRTWRSATPFVPPLHFYTGTKDNPKLKARATPESQLLEALRASGIATPCQVHRLRHSNESAYGLMRCDSVHDMPFWDVVRVPKGCDVLDGGIETKTHRGSSEDSTRSHQRRVGFMFELDFAEPVALSQPALGHSSHFGLGLFVPVPDLSSHLSP